jgi:hypothetical protein
MNSQMLHEMALLRAADAVRAAERERAKRAARERSDAPDDPGGGGRRLRRPRWRPAGA